MLDQLDTRSFVNEGREVTAPPGMQFYRVTTIIDTSPKRGGIPHVWTPERPIYSRCGFAYT